MSPEAQILADMSAFLLENADAARLIGIAQTNFDSFGDMAAAVLSAVAEIDPGLTQRVYAQTPDLAEICAYDIAEAARRNFEPGATAETLLFGRGPQAVLAHRLAHALWQRGEAMLALAVKSRAGRALATDIHPAAKIGRGLWLDHGLGFVVGETCVIGQDVSIWHNVTLGSTLNDSGPQRHPTVQDGVVIGAGAILLGHITIGAQANIAAGAIVVNDVPPRTLVVGAKSRQIGAAQISFTPQENTTP